MNHAGNVTKDVQNRDEGRPNPAITQNVGCLIYDDEVVTAHCDCSSRDGIRPSVSTFSKMFIRKGATLGKLSINTGYI